MSTHQSTHTPVQGGRAIVTHTLGYPRIGAKRELKKTIEAYWQGKITKAGLEAAARDLRRTRWLAQHEAGVALIPSNDFSLYDHVLDASCLFGNAPRRFGCQQNANIDLDTYFSIARGREKQPHDHGCGCGCAGTSPEGAWASEMTKWFDTNYHYIVPEFDAKTTFRLASSKPFDEFEEARALGIRTKPVFVGPVTYLSVGKETRMEGDDRAPSFDRFSLLDTLLDVYAEVIQRLGSQGAEWIQFDEPVCALDLSAAQRSALKTAYDRLAVAARASGVKLIVATYFGELRDNLDVFTQLPVAALHIDMVRGGGEVDLVSRALPPGRILSLGAIDGRNVWRANLEALAATVRKAVDRLGAERVWLAPSCSLLHVPVSLKDETSLGADLREWLSFADEKISELVALADLASAQTPAELGAQTHTLLLHARRAVETRRTRAHIHRPEVGKRLRNIIPLDFERNSPFGNRQQQQRRKLRLPLFPTTTIGSFPQTSEVRAARARLRKGECTAADYEAFLRREIEACVLWQEQAGLDVLVHGEFERNDMVEYFGEQLHGYAFTAHGWVQSYGTRCVKPPIIYADVERLTPMAVEWARYAQSLTAKPMKGMLTGPVTMLQWSFVRDDQPRKETAWQIALALRDEVRDLEAAGIPIIQIDEPALREGLPLRHGDRAHYLDWAVKAFRLSASGVRDDTQIHTHMCYSEFNDIIADIAALDADVITIETSRSNMELLSAFIKFRYPAEIGPGVYDIHSPRVPSVTEMTALIRKACEVINFNNLWVNPDCGLKTRAWPEVKEALVNMVSCARMLREEHTGKG